MKHSNHAFIIMIILTGLICFDPSSVLAFMAKKSEVQCIIESDRAILPAGGPQKTIIKVTLDAPPPPEGLKRPPVNLSIVLDRSGSMSGEKIKKARDAAVEALKRLNSRDIFSMVVYDHAVETIIPAQPVVNPDAMIRKINTIRTGGSTALFGGVSQGAAEVRKYLEGSYVHRIILLSDGLANVGPSTPEDLGRLGAALGKENISVTTVGVGTDYNEDLMARLSEKSDGNIYFVESSYDLPKIFAAELGDVLNVVAKKVRVTIEVPHGVVPLSIIGREGRIKGQQVEFSMNQLYGAQEKYALIEVQLPSSKNGDKLKVASANVRYNDPFSMRSKTAKGQYTARFSNDSEKVEKSTNISVVREYELNLNAIAEEKAISLADKGKKKEAVKTLKEAAAKLKDIGKTYRDDTLLMEADRQEERAELIEKEGMSKKSRKILRTKSYQQKYQQSQKK